MSLPTFRHALDNPNHPGHDLARLTLSLSNLHDFAERFVSVQSSAQFPSELDSKAFSAYESTCWELYELLRDQYHIEEGFFAFDLFPEDFQPILKAAIEAQDRASFLLAEYWTPERAGEAQERSAERFEEECEAVVEECTELMKEES